MFGKKFRNCPPECGYLGKAARGTWNFTGNRQHWHRDVPVRRILSMDVNMRRLPDEFVTLSKFLVPLAGLLWHPPPADSADIPSKQAERQSTTSKMRI